MNQVTPQVEQAMFDIERAEARRAVNAIRLLAELGVTAVKDVFLSWQEHESDWPADTICYIDMERKPVTALITDDTITLVSGWHSPGA